MAIGINFHNTFPPTSMYLSRILAIADGKKRSTVEISDLTGIPQGKSTGKVMPHVYYLQHMGLLNEDGTSRTPLGECVFRNDSSLEDALTQWLLHIRLTSISGADMWHYVVRELLAANSGSISAAYYAQQMILRYGNRTRYAVICTSYQNALHATQYLGCNKDNDLHVKPQNIRGDYRYVYAYALLHEWEQCFPSENEISEEQLHTLSLGTVMGIDKEAAFEVILTLNDHGLIRLNRQLAPFTVVRVAALDDLIPKLYSLQL